MLKKRLRTEVDTHEAESQADVAYIKTCDTIQSQTSMCGTLLNNYSLAFKSEGSSAVGCGLVKASGSNFVDISFKYYQNADLVNFQ